MKCPKCNAAMLLQMRWPIDGRDCECWECPNCHNDLATLDGQPVKWDYLCAFCHHKYFHVQTEDHTPLAELICPKCAKKMDIEVQTHPDNPENEDNLFSGC